LAFFPSPSTRAPTLIFLPKGTISMRHNPHGFLNRGQNPVLASVIANFMPKFLRLTASRAAGPQHDAVVGTL
jgi:hypothetical protein